MSSCCVPQHEPQSRDGRRNDELLRVLLILQSPVFPAPVPALLWSPGHSASTGGSPKVLDLSPAGQGDTGRRGGGGGLCARRGSRAGRLRTATNPTGDQTEAGCLPVTSPLRIGFSFLELPSKHRLLNAQGWDVSKYVRAANLLTLKMTLSKHFSAFKQKQCVSLTAGRPSFYSRGLEKKVFSGFMSKLSVFSNRWSRVSRCTHGFTWQTSCVLARGYTSD